MLQYLTPFFAAEAQFAPIPPREEGFELLNPIGSGEGRQGTAGAIAFARFLQMAHNNHVLSCLLNAHVKAHVDTLLKKQHKRLFKRQAALPPPPPQQQQTTTGGHSRRHHRSNSMPSSNPYAKDTVYPSANLLSPSNNNNRVLATTARSSKDRLEVPPDKAESQKVSLFLFSFYSFFFLLFLLLLSSLSLSLSLFLLLLLFVSSAS